MLRASEKPGCAGERRAGLASRGGIPQPAAVKTAQISSTRVNRVEGESRLRSPAKRRRRRLRRPRRTNAREASLQPVQLHRDTTRAPIEPLGRVLSVDGAQATVRLNVIGRAQAHDDAQATVGKFL